MRSQLWETAVLPRRARHLTAGSACPHTLGGDPTISSLQENRWSGWRAHSRLALVYGFQVIHDMGSKPRSRPTRSYLAPGWQNRWQPKVQCDSLWWPPFHGCSNPGPGPPGPPPLSAKRSDLDATEKRRKRPRIGSRSCCVLWEFTPPLSLSKLYQALEIYNRVLDSIEKCSHAFGARPWK